MATELLQRLLKEEPNMPVNKPAIDDLDQKVDCRYTLVVESA